jgi:outer membrane protein insertion porin family
MRNPGTSVRVGARRAAKRRLAIGLAPGLGALCAVISTLPSFAASPLDDTIVVRGNRRIEAAVVRGYFHAKPDGTLDAGAVNDGFKALYASGLFADVNVAWSGPHLVVTVAEAPVIDRVQFEGNKQFKDKELAGEVRSKARTPLTRGGVQDDVARITELYRHLGRYDVTITPKTIVKGEGRVDLVFEIKEGPKTGIAKIVFAGNHAFSDQRLKGVIKTSESGWLAFLKTTDVYDADRLETDRDLLHSFYLRHGYADAQVVAATGAYDDARKGFVIAFTVDEGDRYRFGTIDIKSSVGAVDVPALHEALGMTSGDVYDASTVDKSVDALALAVNRQGFPFATVHPQAQRDRKQNPSTSCSRSTRGRTPTSSASSCAAIRSPRTR